MDHLNEIRKWLNEVEIAPYFQEVNFEDYVIGVNEFLKIRTKNETPVLVNAILNIATKQVLLHREQNKLRICSLGCGNGYHDKLVITEILKKYPEISIEYVGVEINSTVIKEAKAELEFPNGHVKVTLYNQDFLLDIPEDTFDLVLAIHSIYYVESCVEGVLRMKKLIKETGSIYASLTKEGPLFEPLQLFHKKLESSDPIFSSVVFAAFKQANIPFTMSKGITYDIDLTQAIKNNFETKEHMCLLSFLTRSQLLLNNDAAKRSCINYFKEVARGKPEKFLVEVEVDYFTVNGSFNE